MPNKKDTDVISGPLMEEMSIFAVKAQVKVRVLLATLVVRIRKNNSIVFTGAVARILAKGCPRKA